MGRWSGRKVTDARAYWSKRLPLPCRRCRRPVQPSQRWHVGHVQDRSLGGSDARTNQWPEHARCNERAGGQLGAAITNARRATAATDLASDRARGIRGL